MKNRFTLVVVLAAIAALSLSLVSCSVDNEDIIGTWGCTYSLKEIKDNIEPQRNEVEKDKYYGYVIVFNADGTITCPQGRIFGIYDGDTWMIDGNQLVIDRTYVWDIKKLNKSTLSLKNHSYGVYVTDPAEAGGSTYVDWYTVESANDADVIETRELQFARQ